MGTLLRVLIVEDSEEDTLLIVRELKRGGFDPIHERVETAESMKAALSTKTWDLILADYAMPHFSGLEALKLSKENGLDLPFIIVSGSIGEDVAVEAMKSGAHDYLMKNNLTRLIPAIEQELREAEVRRKLKHSEKALQEAEKRYRQVVENATEIIYAVDEKGNFTYGNPAGLKVTGYSLEELRKLNFADLVLPGHRERVMDIYSNQFRQRIPATYVEFPFFNKAGKIIWFGQNTTLVIEDGKVVGFHIIARDITERKRAEEALQESEEKYRLLVENANEAIFVIQDGMLQFFNIKNIELIGYSREELTSTPFINFVHPDDREVTLGRYLKRIKGEELPGVNVFRVIDKTGNIKWAELNSVLISWGGRPATLNFLNDITERKQAEEQLSKLFRAVEQSPTTVMITDTDANIEYVNPKFTQLTGYTLEDVIGKNPRILKSGETPPEEYKRLWETITSGREWRGEFHNKKKNGEFYLESASISSIKNPEGLISHFVAVKEDITERKRAEEERTTLQEQLRQSQKMEAIGRLAGGVAHDFNNILTVIKGYSQFSLAEIKEEDPLRENIEEIKKSADRAADLTRQLLAFSRRQIMEVKILDLNTLLQNLDKMLRRIIGEDIELVTLLREDLGRVKADPGQIEQVVMNLAVNAKDAMSKGGKLIIETANVELDKAYAQAHVAVKPGPYVMIAVSDTGTGMAPEVRDRVFEPFFTTKGKGKGTGLGLSTVYGIVKQSGGNIWVYSEPGQGTTLKIYLPRVDEPAEKLEAQVIGEEFPRGSETILIVEDDKEVRKLAVGILKRQGYTVLDGSYGDEAFNVCRQHKGPIRLLVTDVVMPGMDGRALSQCLSQLHPEMKVLYMSGYTDDAIIHHGVMDKGMNFIQKPFTVNGLTKKVREVLDK